MAEDTNRIINDATFAADVKRLRQLRTFLNKQALIVEFPPTPLSFAAVSGLTWLPTGRAPTDDERSTVELQTEAIFRSLSEPLRRKFLMGETPWWLTALPVIFTLLAVAALFFSIQTVARAPAQVLSALARSIQGLPPEVTISAVTKRTAPTTDSESETKIEQKVDRTSNSAQNAGPLGASILPYYLLWLISLGATGAVAFVGMNVLSVQEDATFDLTNPRLMILRIVVGSLFGLVLTLPFGYSEYVLFCIALVGGVAGAFPGSALTKQAIMLLLPFVLGFSTTLVIMILNQFVEGIQAFFGKKTVNTSAVQATNSAVIVPPPQPTPVTTPTRP